MILSALIARTKIVSHNYGVQITSTFQEAYDLDKSNDNTLWRDTLNKEMEKLTVKFVIFPYGKYPQVYYTKASGRLIFDVSMTLERNSRWVKDVHKTPQLELSNFASVVSREIIIITITYSTLS